MAMVTYVYRCLSDGSFDLRRPFGQAVELATCPTCGAAARRVFTSPLLGTLDARVNRAYDDAARSADTPAVVSALPGPRPQRPLNPAVRRLPRP